MARLKRMNEVGVPNGANPAGSVNGNAAPPAARSAAASLINAVANLYAESRLTKGFGRFVSKSISTGRPIVSRCDNT